MVKNSGFCNVVSWTMKGIAEVRDAGTFAATLREKETTKAPKLSAADLQRLEERIQCLAQQYLDNGEPLYMGIIILCAGKP